MKSARKKIFLFLLCVCLVSVVFVNDFDKKLSPIIYEYGRHKCINISTMLINSVVKEVVTEEMKEEIVVCDEKNLTTIDFNVPILNSLTVLTVKKLQSNFRDLELGIIDMKRLGEVDNAVNSENLKKGIMYEIPFSAIFENSLISNLGIVVPVRYRLVSSVEAQIVSNIKEYGINNTLLEISLDVNVNAAMAIPTLSKEEKINVIIPLVVKLIQGKVPEYYYGSNIFGGAN